MVAIGSGPIVLGIHWAHDASVALCTPDGLIFSVQEERLSRVKHHYGFPVRSIRKALDYCGLTAKDIAAVAFATEKPLYPQRGPSVMVALDGTVKHDPGPDGDIDPDARMEKVLRNAAPRWGEMLERHYAKHGRTLLDMGLFGRDKPYYYVGHHRAHASAAFRLSGRPNAVVVTLDGKGDGNCATIYLGKPDGSLTLLRRSAAQDSLGSMYQAATEALGFVPVDSEYKTMGLAALWKPDGAENPFDPIVHVEDGVLHSRIKWEFRDFNEANPDRRVPNPLSSVSQSEDFRPLLETMSREQFSWSVQDACERNMVALVRDAMAISGQRTVVAAGGVFLNVKANLRINDEAHPDDFFVFPDAADSGLAAGAAMEALHHMGALNGVCDFSTPYLGYSVPDAEIDRAVDDGWSRHELVADPLTPAVLVEQLMSGKVIGSFQGRMETGPRALGNRSVLADPRTTAVKDRINLILKGREWFVPFAPVMLADEAHLYWDGPHEYRFMTFAVRANDYAKEKVPAIVHFDGTMRPQIIRQEHNPWLYEVLCEFRRRTGVGVLVNTSFNRHGLPIVGSPADAIEHLRNGWVDGLALGNWYVEKA